VPKRPPPVWTSSKEVPTDVADLIRQGWRAGQEAARNGTKNVESWTDECSRKAKAAFDEVVPAAIRRHAMRMSGRYTRKKLIWFITNSP